MDRDYSISLNGLIKNLEETANSSLIEQYFVKIPYVDSSVIKYEWYIQTLGSLNSEPEYISNILTDELNSLINFGSNDIEYTSFSDELNEVLNNTRVITESKLNELYTQVVTELKLNEFKIEDEGLTIPDLVAYTLKKVLESKYNIYDTANIESIIKKIIDSNSDLDKLKNLAELLKLADDIIYQNEKLQSKLNDNSVPLEYIYDLYNNIKNLDTTVTPSDFSTCEDFSKLKEHFTNININELILYALKYIDITNRNEVKFYLDSNDKEEIAYKEVKKLRYISTLEELMGDTFYEYFFKGMEKEDWSLIKTYLYTLIGSNSIRSALIGLINDKFGLKTVDAICAPVGDNNTIEEEIKYNTKKYKYSVVNGNFTITNEDLDTLIVSNFETLNNFVHIKYKDDEINIGYNKNAKRFYLRSKGKDIIKFNRKYNVLRNRYKDYLPNMCKNFSKFKVDGVKSELALSFTYKSFIFSIVCSRNVSINNIRVTLRAPTGDSITRRREF